MKFFVAFAALLAVAVASPLKPTTNDATLDAIIAAIQSPSTDPATAALLEQQLQDIYGFHPIHVGPAIVEAEPIVEPQPIQVGPAIVEPVKPEPIMTLPAVIPFPVYDEPSPVAVDSPVSSPLVQIIVNVNQASDIAAPVAYPVEDIIPSPVHIVDNAQEEIIPSPVHIVDDAQEEIIPSPVHIVDEVAEEIVPSPVQIVEEADAPAEPIIIANPIVPIPVVNIPEILN